MKLNILDLVTDAKCYDYLRIVRWESGLLCPHCQSESVIKNGSSSSHPCIRRYECKHCKKGFNDLTGTLFSNSNKPLKVWILTLYFMGLNLSNRQIAAELDLSEKTAQRMTGELRAGIVKKNLIYNLKASWKRMKFI